MGSVNGPSACLIVFAAWDIKMGSLRRRMHSLLKTWTAVIVTIIIHVMDAPLSSRVIQKLIMNVWKIMRDAIQEITVCSIQI